MPKGKNSINEQIMGTTAAVYTMPTKVNKEINGVNFSSQEEKLLKNNPHTKKATISYRGGHPRFYELLEEMADLHARKNHDYAKASDPLSNLRMSEQFGVEDWKGCLIRMSDKWCRLMELSKKNPQVVEESFEDTLKDLATYSVLCLILREERAARSE